MLKVKMRTTLTIDDDVLAAAKALAAVQQKSVGKVLSELVRQALQPTRAARRYRNGVPLIEVKSNAVLITHELVNQLHDELL